MNDALFEGNRRAISRARDSARPYYLYSARASGMERDLHSVMFPFRYTQKVTGKLGGYMMNQSVGRPAGLIDIRQGHEQVLENFKKKDPERFDEVYGWGDTDNFKEKAFDHVLEVIYSALPLDMRYGNYSFGGPQPVANALGQYYFDKKAEEEGAEFYKDYRADTLAEFITQQVADTIGVEKGTPEYRLINNWLKNYTPRWGN